MATEVGAAPRPVAEVWRERRQRLRARTGALAARIRLARRHEPEHRLGRLFNLKFLCCIIIVGNQGLHAKEAVIFEQIGQLAGVTAYLHVHVELSISSVEAQLAKYHELLRTHCGSEKAVLSYMMAFVNSSHYIRKEVYGDKPEGLPETSLVKENARLWFKVAKLHIRDLEDMENNVAALRNSLPAMIGAPTGKIPFQAQYSPTPGVNLYNVDAFCDTHDHLLTLTMSGTHYSKLIKEDTPQHSVDISQSYFNVSNVKSAPTRTTTTTSRTTVKGGNWGRLGYSGAKDAKFVSQPLTMQSLDQMVFIHGRPKREI
jgi:hypothetical protein